MKTKKLLSLLLAIVMVVSMMATLGITTFAASPIAMVDGTYYNTFGEAANALATATEKKITLYSNFNLDNNYTVPDNTTIDLNGYWIDPLTYNLSGQDIIFEVANEYDVNNALWVVPRNGGEKRYTIKLKNDVTVENTIKIDYGWFNTLTIDGNGHIITGLNSDITVASQGQIFYIRNSKNINKTVEFKNVTIKIGNGFRDGICFDLEAGYPSVNGIFNNVTVSTARTLAPTKGTSLTQTTGTLIQNNSSVITVKNDLTLVTDEFCWSAIDIDNSKNNAIVTLDSSANLSVTDNRTDGKKSAEPLIGFDDANNGKTCAFINNSASEFVPVTRGSKNGYGIGVCLDLEDSTTNIKDSKDFDQNYTLTVTDGTYTDLTKVKLEWTIGNLSVTRKDAKVWNPDTLTWVDDNGNDEFTLGSDTTSSSFKLTNLSSVPVKANVVFAVEDALKATFNKIVFTNNDCTVASVVDSTTKAVNTQTLHEQTISAALTVNKDKFTGSAATDATYGVYTVTVSSLATAKNTSKSTVNQNVPVSLTVANTLSDDASATTKVEIPANTVSLDAGKVAELNVETTAVAEAMANATFNISENQNAVSAIDLTVKVNGTEIHDFKDANGDPVEVTVTTYIAKGFTNLTMKYVGTGKDDPTVVSYDPATGKLVFKTTHFSTFAIGADENAYIEESNTAYMFGDALEALSAGQTLVVMNDVKNCPALSVEKNTAGTYTVDLGGHTVTFAETTTKNEVAFLIEGEGEYVLKNGTLTCTDYHYGDVIDIWSVTTLENLTVNFTDEAETGFARWGAIYLGAQTTINNCTVNATKGPGIQNGEEGNIVTVNNSTIISGDHSALYCGGGSTTYLNNCTVQGLRAIHGCTSGAAYIINGGTYTGSEKAIQLDNTTSAVDYQGVPNYVGGSYACVKSGTFNGVLKINTANEGNATLEISGGTFTVDPTAYLKSGYEATESAGIWTVTETTAE